MTYVRRVSGNIILRECVCVCWLYNFMFVSFVQQSVSDVSSEPSLCLSPFVGSERFCSIFHDISRKEACKLSPYHLLILNKSPKRSFCTEGDT